MWRRRSTGRRAARAPRTRPVDACKYLGALIASAANGISRSELLSESFWQWGNLHPKIEEVARGSFTRKDPPDIAVSGYVVRSLEAALWALARTDSFRDGALLAVNLGEDADTTGAVYGQLAGAIYGEHAIPPAWRAKLARHDLIVEFASRLHQRREMFTHWQGGETVPATLPAQHSGGGRARRRVVHPLRRWASREWRWRAAPVRARCRGVVRRPRQLVPAGRGGTGGPVNFP